MLNEGDEVTILNPITGEHITGHIIQLDIGTPEHMHFGICTHDSSGVQDEDFAAENILREVFGDGGAE